MKVGAILATVLSFATTAVRDQRLQKSKGILKRGRPGLPDAIILDTVDGSAGSDNIHRDSPIALNGMDVSDKAIVVPIQNKPASATKYWPLSSSSTDPPSRQLSRPGTTVPVVRLRNHYFPT